MDLKEFIKETLSQIVDGVAEAKTNTSGKEVTIAPKELQTSDRAVKYIQEESIAFPSYEVDFQVELIVDETKSGNKGIKVGVAGISVGGSGNTESSNRSSTMVRFSVPIIWRSAE